MTIDHPVRRWLARICSTGTMARVVDPTLGDVRFEDGHLTWRGGLALARALTTHALLSLPGAVSRLWTDDDRALPRAAAAGTVTTLLLAAPLVAFPVVEAHLPLSPWRSAVLLAPQGLVLALPAALLVAIPVAFRRAPGAQRILRRGLVLSALCAAATFVMLTWVMPDANQTWREEVSARLGGRAHFDRGPNELSVHELRERIDGLRRTGADRPARIYERAYHERLALPSIALPLGVIGIAIARSRWGRARPVMTGAAGIVAYVLVFFPAAWLAARLTWFSPAVAVWTPAVGLAALAFGALRCSEACRRVTTSA
jgi:hypothetical protein